ncbi:hypothetical protein [Haloferula sp.]|uniref:hypothetical protein n=1 Tax=Haloferula sp. TaxID=2497595 RepID=UPI00329E6858
MFRITTRNVAPEKLIAGRDQAEDVAFQGNMARTSPKNLIQFDLGKGLTAVSLLPQSYLSTKR